MHETRSEPRALDALDPLHLSVRAEEPAASRAEKGTDGKTTHATPGNSPYGDSFSGGSPSGGFSHGGSPSGGSSSGGSVSASDDVALCAEQLRSALRRHGITLPSLGVDLAGFAGTQGPLAGLVALGNCNLPTARALTRVLREAAGE